MISLIVGVFLVQLACYIVSTVGSKAFNDLLWQITSLLPLQSSQDIQEQVRLRREVVRLKREMAAVSAQDEFSKWAKLRRQHDKALEQHDKKAAAVSSSRQSFDTKAGVLRWTFTSGLRMGMQFYHAKTPVFTYPRGWFPWYIEWVLGFPRCPYGGVSVNVWSSACATVIAIVAELIFYCFQYVQERQGAGGVGTKEKVPVPAEAKKTS